MKLLLIRHTPVALPAGICYGISDVPLAEGFERTAAQIRPKLPREALVLSSSSQRCLKLAALLSDAVISDDRLCELNFGEWELRAWDDIPRAQLDAWSEDFVHRAPPSGESFLALARRAHACLSEFRSQFPKHTLVCVTHAGVIRAITAMHRKLPLREAFSIAAEPGALFELSDLPALMPFEPVCAR